MDATAQGSPRGDGGPGGTDLRALARASATGVAFGLAGLLVLAGPARAQQEDGGAPPTPLDPTRPMPSDYRGDAPGEAAWDDPNHPLKGNEDPGSAWDASNLDRWHGDHRETPPIRNGTGDWDWGELFFDRTYSGTLLVKNRCPQPQVVSVTVHDLPYLRDVPARVDVPGSDTVKVPVEIVTPPEPDPPVNPTPFDPTAPGFGWVEPPDLPPRPNPFDPTAPEWHQPNFVPVEGRVVLWHPWKGACTPRRVTYRAAGHIHWEPPPDGAPDRGPEEIAKPDPCAVHWNTGQPPPDLGGRDCTEAFRGFAVAFREKVLRPRAEEDPAAWEWLPSTAELQRMSSDQLLAFRERAAEVLEASSSGGGRARGPGVGSGGHGR